MNLVIVESPAKAKTLSKFLGKDYRVEASIGHIRDLPESASAIPAKYKKEAWARLGVDVDNGFVPLYVVPSAKRDQIAKLRSLVSEADRLYLATDEDREGESISWHLREVLKPKVPIHRLVFHEITKEAVTAALDHCRDIDEDLVEAQEARRIVDRLYGYLVSPLLWKKVKPRLSAGRVQSVAVRLVVERERARMAFKESVWWDLLGTFARQGGDEAFDARMVELGGRRLAQGRDFDPETGNLPADKHDLLHLGPADAEALRGRLTGKQGTVASLERKPYTERPAPPFTTSTLQQAANGRLRYSARRTMDLAQRLYENGFITYMRTDSTTLSNEALGAARDFVAREYGPDYLPPQPRTYKSKVKNAQEAHEAIRPSGASFPRPGAVAQALGRDAEKLYELILARTLACQMADARGQRVTLELDVEEARFRTGGKMLEFAGWRRAYGVSAGDDNGDDDKDARIPELAVGDRLELRALAAEEHKTQPPARLTEASLVKELEARGIGRPSTYASIIETILKREYVRKQGNALIPTFTAFAVTRLLEDYLGHLVDYSFTAVMEDELDSISLGKMDQRDYLEQFYNGNGKPGLKDTLARVEPEIDPREVCGITLGTWRDQVVEVRVGRYGPFVSMGDLRASVPEDLAPDELRLEDAVALIAKAAAGPRVIGKHPETGQPVYAKNGRYGPYVQLGDPGEGPDEKPKMASLLAGMELESVTLEQAMGLLDLPRDLGPDPRSGEPVLANNGRYGPYVQCGKETRSLPEGTSPLEVDLAQALALLAKPKERRRARARREPLKVLGPHPESGAEVKILDGRFGPYVTDGTSNASLPRGTTIEEVTLDMAAEMLAAKASAPPRKRGGRKKAAKKTAKKAAKKATKKAGKGRKKKS
ncbi:MAG: type I DNA topoisomerase [Planctomycetota bacterium]